MFTIYENIIRVNRWKFRMKIAVAAASQAIDLDDQISIVEDKIIESFNEARVQLGWYFFIGTNTHDQG